MNTTPAPKRTLKTRIKHRTPEILIGASVVAGLVGFVYIRNNIDLKAAAAFATSAADPNVEIIAGNDDAFVVMTSAALETLEKFGKLDIGDKDAIRYVLSLADTQ